MNIHCENVVFILKTSNFKHDQRVHKEADILLSQNIKVSFFVKSCDEVRDSDYCSYRFIKKTKWNRKEKINTLSQYTSDVFFQLSVFFYLIFSGFFRGAVVKKQTILWVCDPVMFPLVILAKIAGYKIVWDQHELPPSRYLNSGFFIKFFKLAYRKSDLCIHANKERLQYLERLLKVKSKNSLVMSNLPISIEKNEVRFSFLPESFDETSTFIYLQNSYSDARCGLEIISALNEIGVSVICAGSLTDNDYQLLVQEGRINKNNFHNVGYLTQSEINWFLARCSATIILYKNTSMNQWYCDPNRLYQAMIVGAPIITASNPTIISTLQNYDYERIIVLADDGSSMIEIKKAVITLMEQSIFEQTVADIPVWSSHKLNLITAISKI